MGRIETDKICITEKRIEEDEIKRKADLSNALIRQKNKLFHGLYEVFINRPKEID